VGLTLAGGVFFLSLPPPPPPPPPPRSWREAWTTGDRVTVALLAASLLLMVAAPAFTEHDWAGATQVLLSELHPFPGR
jgi:hypothetical protein